MSSKIVRKSESLVQNIYIYKNSLYRRQFSYWCWLNIYGILYCFVFEMFEVFVLHTVLSGFYFLFDNVLYSFPSNEVLFFSKL